MTFYDLLKGKEIPIRSSIKFHELGARFIIKDKKIREYKKKETGKPYFESYKEFTDFAADQLSKQLLK